MKALCWNGKQDVHVCSVPDPTILNPNDATIKVTATAICGSDLHLYDGFMPGMESGDVVGHEFMGEVVEVGRHAALPPGAGRRTVAVAMAAMPSRRPVKPRRSEVVALTDTASTAIPAMLAMRARMASRSGTRLMPISSASSYSGIRLPAGSSPRMILVRIWSMM